MFLLYHYSKFVYGFNNMVAMRPLGNMRPDTYWGIDSCFGKLEDIET